MVGKGAQVVAISHDDVPTLKKFKESLKAPFLFLADEDGSVSKAYGGTTMGFSSRATYVIGTDGKIVKITSGSDAIDPAGDITSCPLHKKAG